MESSPILNNPYQEPLFHYATAADGEQKGSLDYSRIVAGRRIFTNDLTGAPTSAKGQKSIFDVTSMHHSTGDGAYGSVFAKELAKWSIDFERASRPESTQGFVPVSKRWVVERSIAWTNFLRRIVKDYEYTLSSWVGWLLLANIQVMLQRIKPMPQR